MNNKLIFDIGMHIGEDTRHYLSKGYKVIAVEANPLLAEQNNVKFKKEITAGKLIILNVGIAESDGVLPFYRNHRLTDWSSFDKDLGGRNGTSYDVIDVPCISTQSLFEKYGIPFYFKVDIEGYDWVCVNALDKDLGLPKYFSCEGSEMSLLDTLYKKGYSKFKLINQANNFEPININQERKQYFPKYRIIMNGIKLRLQKVIPIKHFYGSAGPFAEDTKGEWLDYDTTKKLFSEFLYGNDGKGLNNTSWFDIHATY